MNISEISIRNPVFAWMLMAFLIVFGAISFQRMGVSQLPIVDFPVITVSIDMPGASPEVLEVEVVDRVESVLTSVQGLKSLSSTSNTGVAVITVEFALDKNIDVAIQEVQNAIGRISNRLPKGVEPPVVAKANAELSPIMWLAISGKLPQRELMDLIRDKLRDRFTTIEGVGEVILGGFIEPSLRVWINPKKLIDYELTPMDIVRAIGSEHLELPSGLIDTPTREFDIRTLGEASTVDAFGDMAIQARGNTANFRPTKLKDVSTIEDGLNDIRALSSWNGNPAVGLGIQLQPGANAVEVGHKVKARMQEVTRELPPNVYLRTVYDSTIFVEESVKDLDFTLLLSALLTALVCLLFLGSFSATFNVILAIPTSIIGSFIVLNALGFTLNFFTLLGLSLAIGIVVDDAIMVLENIVRHRERGEGKIQAAILGSKEITLAALAATTAVIAIYLPVAFMQGIIGKFFFQFGVTLSVAVAISLLEALTLAPMRCAQFLAVGERSSSFGKAVDRGFDRLSALYGRAIKVTLHYRWTVLLSSLLFFAGSLFLISLIKKEFIPPEDQSLLVIRFETPVGSSIDYTQDKFRQVEKFIKSQPEFRGYYGVIGGLIGGQINLGLVFVTFKPPSERTQTQQEIGARYRKELLKIPGLVSVVIQDPSLSGFTAKRGFPIEFTIRGPDYDTLIAQSKIIIHKMKQSGLMTDIDTDYHENLPEIQIIPDREKALKYAVEVADIATTVQIMMGGAIAGQFTKNGHRYNIRVRVKDEDRAHIEDIGKLAVRNTHGELVPISQLASIKQTSTLQAITRQDRERAVTIYANPANKSSQAEALDAIQTFGQELPSGYRLVLSGSAQTFQESFQSLIFALILGLVVSYMVLASQFNSFVHPFTVLMALPFSVSGALIALYLGNQTINIYSMIGLLLLMGIVKKNSILLLDFTNRMRESGLGVHEALEQACPIRLRPILMTSIATIAAAIPPAIAIGPGAESRVPMAIAVLGGVIVSTVLTLFVVPSVYSLLSGLERKQYT